MYDAYLLNIIRSLTSDCDSFYQKGGGVDRRHFLLGHCIVIGDAPIEHVDRIRVIYHITRAGVVVARLTDRPDIYEITIFVKRLKVVAKTGAAFSVVGYGEDARQMAVAEKADPGVGGFERPAGGRWFLW